jgi:hypothetical protein
MKLIFLCCLSTFSILGHSTEFNIKNFLCTGEAESGTIIIDEISVYQNNVAITFSKDKKYIQSYILTERMKNGYTDANNTAYFIGATKSGAKNDYEDMSLPHLGLYKNGSIGSEVAFNLNGKRVFGSVICK